MDLGMAVMMKAMSDLNFPPGYGIEMRGDMTQMMDSLPPPAAPASCSPSSSCIWSSSPNSEASSSPCR